MNFSDLQFWVFFSAILAGVLLLRQAVKAALPAHLPLFDQIALASTNLALFFSADARSCVILLIELFLTYSLIKLALARGQASQFICLLLLIGLHLAVLVYFKYAAFFVHEVLGRTWAGAPKTIPAGISFYTFQKLALAIDTVRNRKPLPRLLDFFNYSTFFPQLVAGPIERRDSLLPQIEKFSFGLRLAHLEQAIPLLILGLFYKLVLADNLALYDQRSTVENAFTIWLTTFLFGLRIYFDFSGYSFIALGLARAFGVQLTLNFRSPYASENIREFWQRWHITLSTWFRDYVYLPLGGNRRGNWAFNIAAVFIISGIWHGAGFNFIAWGALHAAAMVFFGWFSRRGFSFPRWLSWAFTMLFVLFSWLFFYETSFPALMQKLAALVSLHAYGIAHFTAMITSFGIGDRVPLVFTIGLALFILAIEFRHRSLPNPYQLLLDWRVSCALAAGLALFAASEDSPFIYFAF